MTDIPYLVRLREDLLTGIGRRQRRVVARRLRVDSGGDGQRRAGGVPARGPSPALAIEPEGDWIGVRIADIAASEAEMERELAAAGIDADIRVVPTTAEHVGKWTCIFFATPLVDPSRQPSHPPQMPAARTDIRFTPGALYFRRGFAERLVLAAGRALGAGEQPSAHPEVCGDVRLVR
jgi:hypothetical protein